MRAILLTIGLGSTLLLVQALAYASSVPEPDVKRNADSLHVVINLPQTRLFLYDKRQLVKTWPVAVGKMLTKTPTGSFEITGIYRDPVWYVPKSIQQEMKARGNKMQAIVPAGENNPLGKVFIRFGASELRLGMHGTNVPGSVPGFRSHGCIRMKNDDVIELSNWVSRGTTVTVAYQPILLNVDANDELWLTVYRNRYRREEVSSVQLAEALINWQRDHHRVIDRTRVDKALRQRTGVPVCLTCRHKEKPSNVGKLAAVRWLSLLSEEIPSPPTPLEPKPASAPVTDPAPLFEPALPLSMLQ